MKKMESKKNQTALKLVVVCVAIFLVIDCNVSLFFFEKFFVTEDYLTASLKGKRIWITGASSGIGAEFAKQLGGKDAHLILSSRKRERLEEFVLNSGLNEDKITIVPFDMAGSASEIENAVNFATRDGDVDILILNAAIFQEQTALETSISDTQNLMQVNFEGPVQLSTELIKQNKWEEQRRGHILVISSRFGKTPGPLSSSYCATKYALHGYFSALNVENSWLRVDFALPGPVDTSLYKNVNEQNGQNSFYGSLKQIMMNPARVAQLAIAGITGPKILFHEMWISKSVSLIGFYINQYIPLWASFAHDNFGKYAVCCHENGCDNCSPF